MQKINFRFSSNLAVAEQSVPIYFVNEFEGELAVFGDPNPVELVPDIKLVHLGLSKSNPIAKIPTTDGVVGFVLLDAIADASSIRSLGGALARTFSDFDALTIFNGTCASSKNLAEGLSLGNYRFDTYKSKSTPIKLKTVTFVADDKVSTKELNRIQLEAQSVHEVRNLVNSPANDVYPATVAEWALKNGNSVDGLKIEIWDEKRLAKEKCGGILAVGQGSVRPPRLVKISYQPKGAKTKLALVGKGITFDTGGLSLKPAGSMVGMKYDMTGAAIVLNAAKVIAELKLPISVTAWACLAENMPSGSATRPNDVVKARNGKTIEVMNTDAEGRVVLADGLSLASEEKPDLIVDVATLTGAATVALGNRYAGLMGSDEAIAELKSAADQAGELLWHMPLPEDLRPILDSPIADIANAKIGNTSGGMLLGGLFLKEFVGNDAKGHPIPWAHLDIAGPANNDKEPYGYVPKGATGLLVRTLIVLAERLSSR